ncbi:MAG TPA: RNA 2',3'-cyclic phosphodiesterase [Blastocatellia bacterium]|nr:RNA 2',3'-cyclic phosphodiesterase [Blastocatellia bacterium]
MGVTSRVVVIESRGEAKRGEMGVKRVFLAVDVPEAVREAAARHSAGVRRQFPGARVSWVRAENLHITLRFYGEVEEPRLPAIAGAARLAAAAAERFSIEVGDPGTFGTKVLFLSIHDDEGKLRHLNTEIEAASAAAGLKAERLSFKPHLTLARMRSGKGVGPLVEAFLGEDFLAMEFEVREMVLYESRLSPAGSQYLAIERFPLGG